MLFFFLIFFFLLFFSLFFVCIDPVHIILFNFLFLSDKCINMLPKYPNRLILPILLIQKPQTHPSPPMQPLYFTNHLVRKPISLPLPNIFSFLNPFLIHQQIYYIFIIYILRLKFLEKFGWFIYGILFIYIYWMMVM